MEVAKEKMSEIGGEREEEERRKGDNIPQVP